MNGASFSAYRRIGNGDVARYLRAPATTDARTTATTYRNNITLNNSDAPTFAAKVVQARTLVSIIATRSDAGTAAGLGLDGAIFDDNAAKLAVTARADGGAIGLVIFATLIGFGINDRIPDGDMDFLVGHVRLVVCPTNGAAFEIRIIDADALDETA